MTLSNVHSFKRNQRYNGRGKYPELVVAPTPAEREETYYAALELVAQIDEALTRGTRHYRNKAGNLLNTLDEVINAILTDDLHVPELYQESEMYWSQELAA
jgi:hypothetical protein